MYNSSVSSKNLGLCFQIIIRIPINYVKSDVKNDFAGPTLYSPLFCLMKFSFPTGRIHDLLMDPYFMCSETKEHDLDVLQKKASMKQGKRVEVMGELLRSKGFMWIASAHWVMGGWQQAGNILRY